MDATRDNDFTNKQLRGIDLTIKSAIKKFPFIKGWQFGYGFEKYNSHLYIDLIVDYEEVLKFYNTEYHPIYKTYKTPNKGSLILTQSMMNPMSSFDSPEYKKFFEKSYNETRKITNHIEEVYKNLPDELSVFYKSYYGNEVKLVKCNLSVSEFIEIEPI